MPSVRGQDDVEASASGTGERAPEIDAEDPAEERVKRDRVEQERASGVSPMSAPSRLVPSALFETTPRNALSESIPSPLF